MILTSDKILSEDLLKLDQSKGKVSQVGYDLSVKKISRMSTIGMIFKDSTTIPILEEVHIQEYNVDIEDDSFRKVGWLLEPGCYEVIFHEGVRLPANRTAFLVHRSSLYRSGASINSPIFDPGFETDTIGSNMIVYRQIFIEKDSRLGQLYFVDHEEVSELYDGQFQKDKQRNETN